MPLVKAQAGPAGDDSGALVSTAQIDLLAALSSGDSTMRRHAVRHAARLGEGVLLARHLSCESDLDLRETIQTALIRIGSRESIAILLSLLRSDDASLRNGVIETLQSMGEIVAPEIEDLLNDPDPDVRIFLMNILLSLSSRRVPDIALNIALNDPDANVCAAALDVLAETGRPEMAERLQGLAARFPQEPFMAFAVRSALKRIG